MNADLFLDTCFDHSSPSLPVSIIAYLRTSQPHKALDIFPGDCNISKSTVGLRSDKSDAVLIIDFHEEMELS